MIKKHHKEKQNDLGFLPYQNWYIFNAHKNLDMRK